MAGYDEILGHESIIKHFKSAIINQKISHAYIINGESGTGKKMLAKAFAMAIQCEEKSGEPCMNCKSCRQALGDNQPDIKWLVREKPNSIGIEEIREQINNDVDIKPYSNKYKVYIIDKADQMTPQAQNALLKTTEEPPAYVVIILITTNSDTLLPTILSRCVSLDIRPLDNKKIKDYLLKNIDVKESIADLAVAFAGGNLGKAILVASNEQFGELKDDVLQVVKHIKDMSIAEVVESVKRAGIYKLEIDDYMDFMVLWFRDVLMYKATKAIDELIFKDEYNYIIEQATKMSYNGIENVIEAIKKVKVRLKANVNFDLTLQLMYMTIMEEVQ